MGSPPQVRGKRNASYHSARFGWITPAVAGKTEGVYLFAPPKEDHPRRCGENRHRYISPPHTCGITPAGAGKTGGGELSGGDVEDHPRRCGENISDPACCSSIKGSPPQVRGKPERNISGRSGFGITPAGAGKTCFVILISSVLQDHPRRCGENRSGTVRTKTTRGSPPQVRGKPCCAFVTASRSRITPAGAGKTRYSCRMCSRSRDHPRRCGENKETMTEDAENAGSPPQVRGKLQLNAQYRLGRRITPAGAGKTTHTMEV